MGSCQKMHWNGHHDPIFIIGFCGVHKWIIKEMWTDTKILLCLQNHFHVYLDDFTARKWRVIQYATLNFPLCDTWLKVTKNVLKMVSKLARAEKVLMAQKKRSLCQKWEKAKKVCPELPNGIKNMSKIA